MAACAGASQDHALLPTATARRSALATASGSPISHITVVMMENADYSSVAGNSSAPYINQLAQSNAVFTNSHGVTHPSEPNYLAIFSGSTQGVTTDGCPVTSGAVNLASELQAAGLSFEGYVENWPGSGNPCYADASSSVGSKYMYWRKHVPWTDFTNVDYGAITHAYGGPGTALTGSVNFIIPNICDDMHDCSIASGDAWLSRNIPAIQSYDDSHNGLLIVTFDEGEYSSTNHVLTIMSGPMVNRGSYTQSITHYNVLRLIESNFGLPLLGASASAAPITGAISGGAAATPAPTPTSAPPPASFVRSGTVGAVGAGTLDVQFGSGCGWDHVNVGSSTVYSPGTWRPAPNDAVIVYSSSACTAPMLATEIVKAGSTAATPQPAPSSPSSSAPFVRSGTVGSTSGSTLDVQFGSGCGWDHVNVTASTIYSPSTWRPAANDVVTVYSAGDCTGPLDATEIAEGNNAATPSPSAQYVRAGTVGAVSGNTLDVQFGPGCGWDHVNLSSSTVFSPSTWRPAANDSVTVYSSGDCTGPMAASEVVEN